MYQELLIHSRKDGIQDNISVSMRHAYSYMHCKF